MFPFNPPLWSLFFELLINVVYGAFLFRWNVSRLIGLLIVSSLALAFLAIRYGFDVPEVPPRFAVGLGRVTVSFTWGILLYRLTRGGFNQRVGGFTVVAITLFALLAVPRLHVPNLIELIFVFVIGPALLAISSRIRVGNAQKSFCKWAGDLSYPIYAIHFPILNIAMYVFQRMNLHGFAMLVFVAGTLGVILVLSYVALRWIDKPVRRWLLSHQSGV